MKEATLVRRVLTELNAVPGCKAVKVHGSQYTEAGTPDIFGCYHGKAFLIECKVGNNVLGKIQQWRFEAWMAAGATVVVGREGFNVSEFVVSLAGLDSWSEDRKAALLKLERDSGRQTSGGK